MFTRHLFFKFFLFVLMTLIASIITFSKKKKLEKNVTLDPQHDTLALDMEPSTLDKDKKIDSYKETLKHVHQLSTLSIFIRLLSSLSLILSVNKVRLIILGRLLPRWQHKHNRQWVIAVVTLQTFYLGKHDLLTVYLGKLYFLSVTDFSPGNFPRENFIVWVLDMSRKQ